MERYRVVRPEQVAGGTVVVRRSKKRRVFERDKYTCRYCGFDMTLHFAYPHLGVISVDHILAKTAGGSDRMDNLATCCCFCNVRKRNWPVADFLRDLRVDAVLGRVEPTGDEHRLRYRAARARLARQAAAREAGTTSGKKAAASVVTRRGNKVLGISILL